MSLSKCRALLFYTGRGFIPSRSSEGLHPDIQDKLGDLGGATLYNLLTTPPDTAQLIGGFSPAKAILSQRLGTARTVSASSNRITGRAYKTSSGPSYTIPFGRQGASSFEFAAQSSIASSQQANYIATFTPERLRQKG